MTPTEQAEQHQSETGHQVAIAMDGSTWTCLNAECPSHNTTPVVVVPPTTDPTPDAPAAP